MNPGKSTKLIEHDDEIKSYISIGEWFSRSFPSFLLNLYLINIPKHIKLQYIKVIILVSFKIFNIERILLIGLINYLHQQC